MDEQIEELLSPAVKRDRASAPYEQPASTGSPYVDKRILTMQVRQTLAAAQDLHTLASKQALQRLVCLPSSQEQETDWQLAVAEDTELHTAIRKKDDDLLHGLLLRSQGAGINIRNARGDTPLLLVAQTGRSNPSAHMLFKYSLDVDVKNAAGCTALYYAIKKNDDDCMGMLLKHGANPYFADDDGNTLLHVAAQSDAFDCATHLARYLNPNQRNRYDLAPLHIAILKKFEHTAHSILHLADTDPNIPMAGESPLIFAIRNELLEIIRDLVEKGADVNAKDAMGNSALHLALTRRDNIPIMYELLKHGATRDAKDANGDTPLVRAIKNKDVLAVQVLIESGTNPNIPDANKVMPIFLILQQLKDLHCAFCLVDHGANLMVRDAEENTPLHLAVQFESLVSLLINRGLDVNAVNIHGDAPLHCVESITPRSAYVLRLYGADINLKNKEGRTSYEKAVRCRNIDGRLLRILEPGTTLASAIDYGITLEGLPDVQAQETRSVRFVELGKGSHIECVDDKDGQAAAVTEEPGYTQGSQPGDCVHIGGQTVTKLWEQVVAWFCPRERNPEQLLGSAAVINPVAMTGGSSAPYTGASPRGSTDSVVSIDARHNTGLRQRTYEARFFD